MPMSPKAVVAMDALTRLAEKEEQRSRTGLANLQGVAAPALPTHTVLADLAGRMKALEAEREADLGDRTVVIPKIGISVVKFVEAEMGTNLSALPAIKVTLGIVAHEIQAKLRALRTEHEGAVKRGDPEWATECKTKIEVLELLELDIKNRFAK